MNFLEQFDWKDTLFKETEKQAVEDIPVEYHDIFDRHRLDFGMKTDFKVKLTPKDDKAIEQPKPTSDNQPEKRLDC